MGEYDFYVNLNNGWGGHTQTQTHTQTDTHINTMTRPGLRAGPSENTNYSKKEIKVKKI